VEGLQLIRQHKRQHKRQHQLLLCLAPVWFTCVGQGGFCNVTVEGASGAVCNDTCDGCKAAGCSQPYPACVP